MLNCFNNRALEHRQITALASAIQALIERFIAAAECKPGRGESKWGSRAGSTRRAADAAGAEKIKEK